MGECFFYKKEQSAISIFLFILGRCLNENYEEKTNEYLACVGALTIKMI